VWSFVMLFAKVNLQPISAKLLVIGNSSAINSSWLMPFQNGNSTKLAQDFMDQGIHAPSEYYNSLRIHPYTYIFPSMFIVYFAYRFCRLNLGCILAEGTVRKKTVIFLAILLIIALQSVSVLVANKHLISTSISNYTSLMKALNNVSGNIIIEPQWPNPRTYELEWQNISLADLDKYFNEFEMRSMGVNMDLFRDIRNQNESLFYFNTSKVEDLLFNNSLRECNNSNLPETCCIGSKSDGGIIYWNAGTCAPIFANTNNVGSNYFRRLVPQGTKDPSTVRYHTMADVIDLLGNNRTLFFVGDSVTKQIAEDAALCSWARDAKKQDGYPKVAAVLDELNLNETEIRWRYKASLFGWDIETSKGARSGIRYLKAYRPNDDFSNIHYWAEYFQPDVLVINFGLHYLIEERHIYTSMVRNFFKRMRSYAVSRPLIFRETSAQHLATDGGEWNTEPDPEWNITPGLQTCQPLQFIERSEYLGYDLWYYDENNPYEEDMTLFVPTIKKWRDKIVIREALAHGYTIQRMDEYFLKETTASAAAATCKYFISDNESEKNPILFVIPFYDWTEELWDAHGVGEGEGSCEPTHLCSSPLFWEHIYDRIYGILKYSKPFCST
jgi:hypothetical protein